MHHPIYFLQQRNGRWKASTADPNVTRADLKQWAQLFLMCRRKFKHEQPGTADAAMEPDARQDLTEGVVDDEQPREGENEQLADQEEVHEQPFVELGDRSLENTAEAVDHQPAGEQEDETAVEHLDAQQSEEQFGRQDELGEQEDGTAHEDEMVRQALSSSSSAVGSVTSALRGHHPPREGVLSDHRHGTPDTSQESDAYPQGRQSTPSRDVVAHCMMSPTVSASGSVPARSWQSIAPRAGQ